MHEIFILTGVVVKGNQLGKKIGFPTANIIPNDNRTLPLQNGVYAAKVKIRGSMFDGMANIGIRPTLDDHAFTIEVHIFNFHDDLYGQEISIFFYDYIRPEKKFSGLEELKSQLADDKLNIARILSGRPQTDANG